MRDISTNPAWQDDLHLEVPLLTEERCVPGFLPLLRPDLVPRTNGASTIVAASGSATSQGEEQCLLAELCWAMPAVCGQFGQLAPCWASTRAHILRPAFSDLPLPAPRMHCSMLQACRLTIRPCPAPRMHCSVLKAYPFLNRAAAFVYDSGLAAPNVAKLARAAARRGPPAALARAIRTSIAPEAAGRRRLRIDEEEEEDGVDRGDDGSEGEPGSSGDVVEQQEESPSEQHRPPPPPQQAQAADAAGIPAGAAAAERPAAGSYAAALLAAFDDQAVRAARQASRELKAQLMRHNLEVAGALLADTAAAAAAVAGRVGS